MKLIPELSGIIVITALVSLTCGCADSPSEVLAAVESAAEAGDAEAFARHFTSESRPFAQALLNIQKDVRKDEPTKAPIEKIFRSRVVSETVNGNRAIVKIAGPLGPDGIVFLREDGEWKLDVAATEQSVDDFDGTEE